MASNKRKAEDDEHSKQEQPPPKKQKLETNTILSNIGSDSLAAVFSYLSMDDLVRCIQLTCKTFKRVLFSQRNCWKHVLFSSNWEFPERYDPIVSRLDLHIKIRCLQNVKNLIELDYASKHHLAKYCATLERIKVEKGKFPAVLFPQAVQLKIKGATTMDFAKFPRLRKVHIHTCNVDSTTFFKGAAKTIEYIRVKRGIMSGLVSQNTFPNLKKLKIMLQRPEQMLVFTGTFSSIVELDIDNLAHWYHTLQCPNLEIVHVYTPDLIGKLDKFAQLHTVHFHNIVKDGWFMPALLPEHVTTVHVHNCDVCKLGMITETNISKLHVHMKKMTYLKLLSLLSLCEYHGGLVLVDISIMELSGQIDLACDFPPENIHVRIDNWESCGIPEVCVWHLLHGFSEPNSYLLDAFPETTYTMSELRCIVISLMPHVMNEYLLNTPKLLVENWYTQCNKQRDVKILHSVLTKSILLSSNKK